MGFKVLLSGMGADEIFFGYRRQKANKIVQKYNKIPSFIRSCISHGINMLPVSISGKGIKTISLGQKIYPLFGIGLPVNHTE